MQAEVAEVEVAFLVHAAARGELAVSRIGPLVIGAHDAPDVPRLGLADFHAAVAARVVERVDPLVIAADEDDRVGVDVEDEVVAGPLDLARVAREEPAAPPDPVEVELVDPGIGLELALERVPGFVLADQTLEEPPGVGELGGRQERAQHRLIIIGGAL